MELEQISIAALLGTVTPFCSCSSIPLFIGFTSAGLPLGVTFSFLISSPMVDLGGLVLVMSIFGTKVAVVYVILGLVVAVIGGTLIEKMRMEKYVEEFIRTANSVDIEWPDFTVKDRLVYAKEQVLETFKKVFQYILVGVGVGAFIHNWIPEEWIQMALGSNNPFGFFQELLYKIPTKKIPKGKWSGKLSYLKYAILFVFVIIIPITLAVPGFCKYICPAGTLEAGIPLTLENEELRALLGNLFSWKVLLLVIIAVSAVFIFRSFCRFLCPLGAFYAFFNKMAFASVKKDSGKCNGCGKCVRFCKMDVKNVGDRECVQCGECIGECPEGALSRK